MDELLLGMEYLLHGLDRLEFRGLQDLQGPGPPPQNDNFDFDPGDGYSGILLKILGFMILFLFLGLLVLVIALWFLVSNCNKPPADLTWKFDNKIYKLPDFETLHSSRRNERGSRS